MLDGFEARLREVIEEGLEGGLADETLEGVFRPQANLPDVPSGQARVTSRVLDATPTSDVAGAEEEVFRQGLTLATRVIVPLEGHVTTTVQVLDAATGEGAHALLVAMTDRVLLALNRRAVRTGEAFASDTDRGFALERFVFEGLAYPAPEGRTRRAELRYRYSGRFWPVEAPTPAGIMASLPTRMAVFPEPLPKGVVARAGGPVVRVPIAVDLRALQVGGIASAPRRLIARLLGASPGSLEGDTSNVPPGAAAYPPDANGICTLAYRPPASVAGRVRVRVGLGLTAPDGHPSVSLGELDLEVSA